ncbi:MAG: hypothetical protein ACR2I0_09560 [Rhodoferax sp.]
MATQHKLSTVTNELIASYGNTAKNMITAYRVGNERAVGFMDQSWAAAVDKAGTRLSAQARAQAVSAEKKLTAYYAKSVEMTSRNASLVVSKAVEMAERSVEQVAANASRFEQSTGVTTLRTLAVAAVPAAQAMSKVAAKVEAGSDALAIKIAGQPKTKAKAAPVRRAAAKKVLRRTRKAA